MVQPANRRIVTEATVASHVATQITTPGSAAATALNATIVSEGAARFVPKFPEVASAVVNNWNHPAAQYVASPAPRTYFGAASPTGEVVAAQVDHVTGAVRRHVVDVITSPNIDDHNASIISAHPGKRTLVFWNNHSQDNQMRVKVSDPSGDLATLGPKMSFTVPDRVTYAQVWRDEDNPSAGWLFSRTMTLPEPLNFSWWGVRFTVDEATGGFTFGTWREVFKFATGDQGYIITQKKSATELHIAISGHPYVGALHDVHYALFNRVTGAVTSPGTAVAGNALTGTGLQILPANCLKVWTAPAGKVCVLQDVRATDDAAILVSAATTGGSHDYHHVAFTTASNPGMLVPSTGGGNYARTFGTLDRSTLKMRMLVKPTQWYLAGKAQRLAAKWSRATGVVDNNFKSWMLTTNDTSQRLRFLWSADGNATVNTLTSDVFANDVIGVGVDFDPGAGTLIFHQTTDGTTWTQMGVTKTFTASSMYQDPRTPVEVGGIATTDSFNVAAPGTYGRFTMYDSASSSTVIADFYPASASQWSTGDGGGASRTDGLGNTWALLGSVAVVAAGWGMPLIVASTGQGGDFAGIAPGACYSDPGKLDVLYVIVKVAGVWQLQRRSRGLGSAWRTEVVDTYVGLAMSRPKPIVGAGVAEVAYMVTNRYDDYYNYEGSSRVA